jgi:hypothetical protein
MDMNTKRFHSSLTLFLASVFFVSCGGGGGGSAAAMPPAIVTQPASVTVAKGAAAAFSVTAAGDAPLSYQWKRDGVPIAGAASAAYTLAAAAMGDNGVRFTVEVSNASGTIGSAAATLSVVAEGRAWAPAVMLSSGDVLRSPLGPQVSIDATGNAIGVWQEGLGSLVRNAVWASRYVAGTGWSIAATIDDAVGGSGPPQLAMTPGGVAVASFIQSTSNTGGGVRMIANRFDGTAWAGGLRVDVMDAVIDPEHRVAIAPNGVATLAFNQSDNVAGRKATAALSGAAGSWAMPYAIGASGSYSPQVAVAANGDAVMVWLVGETPTKSSLWGSRRLGTAWSAPVRIVSGGRGMGSPRLRADSAGNAIAVWFERPSVRNEVHAARFSASSGSWNAPVVLNDGAAQAYDAELAMTSTGDAIVVWTEASDAGQASGIGANRYLAAAAEWSGETRVQPVGASPGVSPHVALDGTGNAIAIWLQGSLGNAARLEVWNGAFDARDGRWGLPTKLMTDPTAYTEGGESQAPQIALNATGDAVVVWTQRTASAPSPSIWARVYR